MNKLKIQAKMTPAILLLSITTFFLLLQLTSAYKVISTFHDTIHAGEVNYYSLESRSAVVLAMYSIEGDADMYGSPTSKNNKPSADSFEYMSCSCGLDVMVLPMSEGVRRVSVGVFGHVRHANTSYQVWVVEPEEEDVLRYQVWEMDPETMRQVLVIDLDPLVLVNDPTLHKLLDSLYDSDQGVVASPQSGAANVVKTVLEWTGFVLLKVLEVGLEILVN